MSDDLSPGLSEVAGRPDVTLLVHHAELLDRLHAFFGETYSSRERNVDAVRRLIRLGLASGPDISMFLDYVQMTGAHLSIILDGDSLPLEPPAADGASRIKALTAAMIFSAAELAAIVAAGQRPVAWLEALVQIKHDAAARGDDSPLALENHDHDEDSVLLQALRAGMVPVGLIGHAADLGGQGVRCQDLVWALGAEAVPADLLAADPAAVRHLAEIRTGAAYYLDGMPSRISGDDAVKVLRSLVAQDAPLASAVEIARLLVSAGAAHAAEVLELYPFVRDGELPQSLIGRASVAGLTPQQWLPLVTRINSRAAGYVDGGLLPLRTLAEAADAGVSVRPWDENTRLRGASSGYALLATQHEPWCGIYPDETFAGRVVELAKAGVSPGFVDDCYAFFSRAGVDGEPCWSGLDAVVDDILMLHRDGLTLPLVKELAHRALREQPIVMTVAQVAQALKLGVTAQNVREVRKLGGGRQFGAALLKVLAAPRGVTADA